MARQKQEKFDAAYDAYMMAGSADGNSPRPPLFAAECALHLNQLTWAQSALLDALELAENDNDEAGVKSRIAALQFGLNQQLENNEQ